MGFALYAALFILSTSFIYQGVRYFVLFDDMMISMRYAKHLAAGHGLVWNLGGERIEGFTNPLWVLYMTALHLLPIDSSTISLLVQVSGAILMLFTAIPGLHQHAILGLTLRDVTSSDATLAVVWAGALPYFAERSTVDLLGKSDPAIARSPDHADSWTTFRPGHSKWNYIHSLTRYRPDVVVELWHQPEKAAGILRREYVRTRPLGFVQDVYLRRGSGKLDWSRCLEQREGPSLVGEI